MLLQFFATVGDRPPSAFIAATERAVGKGSVSGFRDAGLAQTKSYVVREHKEIPMPSTGYNRHTNFRSRGVIAGKRCSDPALQDVATSYAGFSVSPSGT